MYVYSGDMRMHTSDVRMHTCQCCHHPPTCPHINTVSKGAEREIVYKRLCTRGLRQEG